MTKQFYVELTDTFCGEANYSWCKYFKINASTSRGAISKLSKETGFAFRKYCPDTYRAIKATIQATIIEDISHDHFCKCI